MIQAGQYIIRMEIIGLLEEVSVSVVYIRFGGLHAKLPV